MNLSHCCCWKCPDLPKHWLFLCNGGVRGGPRGPSCSPIFCLLLFFVQLRVFSGDCLYSDMVLSCAAIFRTGGCCGVVLLRSGTWVGRCNAWLAVSFMRLSFSSQFTGLLRGWASRCRLAVVCPSGIVLSLGGVCSRRC